MLYRFLIFVFLLILSIWDIRLQKIPKMLLVMGAIPIIVRIIAPIFSNGSPADRLYSLFASLPGGLPGLVLFILSFFSDKVGQADGIVICLIGIGESVMFSIILMCMSCVLMALPACVFLATHKVHRNTHLPYIPFVAVSYLILSLLNVRLF